MTWIGTAIAGASLVSGLLNSNASSSAADQASSAQTASAAQQLGMFNTINDQGAPYRAAGASALGAINNGFAAPQTVEQQAAAILAKYPTWNAIGDPNNPDNHGTPQQIVDSFNAEAANTPGIDPNDAATLGGGNSGIAQGQFSHTFDANDLTTNLAPNYAFQLGQGQGALENILNKSGGLGGNYAQGLEQFTQDYAGSAYQNAFNNYNTNQSNIFSRLATIAGLGQQSNATTAGAGSTISGNAGNATAAAGTAQAAGTIGSANALSSGLQNASGWYGLNSLLGQTNTAQSLQGNMVP